MIAPLEAVVRHPIIALLPIIIAIGAALYVGLSRDPVYTSTARVTVGRSDVAAYLLQSVVAGNQALAAAYARVISTQSVAAAAGHATGLPPGVVQSRVSASQVPGSTLIQVDATGPSSASAIALANAASRSLIAYVHTVTQDTQSAGAFRRFRAAQASVVRDQRRVNSLAGQGPRHQDQLARARVNLEADKLQASNLANIYRASTQDPTSGGLRLIAPAATASSDKRSMLERVILIGLAAGLVLGIGLALLRSNFGRLRAMRE